MRSGRQKARFHTFAIAYSVSKLVTTPAADQEVGEEAAVLHAGVEQSDLCR